MLFLMTCLDDTFAPPLFLVYHPAKAYPDLVGDFSDPTFLPFVTGFQATPVSLPPFAFSLTTHDGANLQFSLTVPPAPLYPATAM